MLACWQGSNVNDVTWLLGNLLAYIYLMIPFAARIYEVFLWLLGDMKTVTTTSLHSYMNLPDRMQGWECVYLLR